MSDMRRRSQNSTGRPSWEKDPSDELCGLRGLFRGQLRPTVPLLGTRLDAVTSSATSHSDCAKSPILASGFWFGSQLDILWGFCAPGVEYPGHGKSESGEDPLRRAVKTYRGQRNSGRCTVEVDNQLLDPRYDLRSHLSEGFDWGYVGGGPARLALAILADCVGDEQAIGCYQPFHLQVISPLNRTCWELSEERVNEWVRARYAERGL